MDTRKLYRVRLVNGTYAIEFNSEVKFLYDETESGDLVPVAFTQSEGTVRPLYGCRGPLRVKYKKAK